VIFTFLIYSCLCLFLVFPFLPSFLEGNRSNEREKIRRKEEEEDPAKYWTTLRKRQDTAICKTVHYIALSGELA